VGLVISRPARPFHEIIRSLRVRNRVRDGSCVDTLGLAEQIVAGRPGSGRRHQVTASTCRLALQDDVQQS